MEAQFWLNKWACDQIGFHEAATHPCLLKHWDTLGVADRGRIFTPLCGKSHDLIWLRDRGYEVVGSELSQIAVEALFEEHNISFSVTPTAHGLCFTGDAITIYCGDHFLLDKATLGAVDAVYDRAALIALPEAMRRRYASKMNALRDAAKAMFLITVNYDQSVISPPPFVVPSEEINSLYGDHWRIRLIETSSAKVKGHAASEQVYFLTPH